MGDEDSSSSPIPSDLHAILEAQKNVILSAVNTHIQGLQSNLLKAQTDLASQIASEVQPETYVFKKKGNEQQLQLQPQEDQEEFCRGKSLGEWEHWQGEGGVE